MKNAHMGLNRLTSGEASKPSSC